MWDSPDLLGRFRQRLANCSSTVQISLQRLRLINNMVRIRDVWQWLTRLTGKKSGWIKQIVFHYLCTPSLCRVFVQAAVVPVVKIDEMESKELLAEILSLAASALEKFADEKQAAAHIKKTLDGRPAPGDVWHVIMGRTFGGYCQYAKGHYVYFYIGQV
jgi:hypothetical protein